MFVQCLEEDGGGVCRSSKAKQIKVGLMCSVGDEVCICV
jgi:hypothetical protein